MYCERYYYRPRGGGCGALAILVGAVVLLAAMVFYRVGLQEAAVAWSTTSHTTRIKPTTGKTKSPRRTTNDKNVSVDDDNHDPFGFGLDDKTVRTIRRRQRQHRSSPPHAGTCSCWNYSSCCERIIHANHKFGYFLVVHALFGPGGQYHSGGGGPRPSRIRAQARKFHDPSGRYFDLTPGGRNPGVVDYREVFVTRNWFDALVSGYLYHKAGHECWLGTHGQPNFQGRTAPPMLMMMPTTVANATTTAISDDDDSSTGDHQEASKGGGLPLFPPTGNRMICQYLVEESELAGMYAYARWVVTRYYKDAITIFKAVHQREDPRHRRTMFACFETLNDPSTRVRGVQEILEWFYPGGIPNNLLKRLQQQQHQQSQSQGGEEEAKDALFYHGVHATDHDPVLRARLRKLAVQVDRDYFHGTIARASDLFQCGGGKNK